MVEKRRKDELKARVNDIIVLIRGGGTFSLLASMILEYGSELGAQSAVDSRFRRWRIANSGSHSWPVSGLIDGWSADSGF